MDIFKNLVPLVAFWVLTGEEMHIGAGVIVPNQYGYSYKTTKDGKPYYIPISGKVEVTEGQSFSSAKVALVAQTGYTRDRDNNLVVAEPKPDALKVWRVVELVK